MAHHIQDDDEALSEVNVIPLADLSLVLLIILMVLSPMVAQSIIQMNRGQAQAAEVAQELTQPETPVIVSYEPGALRLNGMVMGSELEFVKHMEDCLLRRRDRSVNITCSPALTHGQVVHVMDLVQRHGATSLVMLKWDNSPNQPALIAEQTAPSKGHS